MTRSSFLFTLAAAILITTPHATAVDTIATAKALTPDTVQVTTTIDGNFVGDVLPVCDTEQEAEGTLVGTIDQTQNCFRLPPNEASTDDVPTPVCSPIGGSLWLNRNPPAHAEPRMSCINDIIDSVEDRLKSDSSPIPVYIKISIPW